MRFILLAAAVPLVLAACSQQPAGNGTDPAGNQSPIPVEPDGGTGAGATPLPHQGGTTSPTPIASDTSGIPDGGIPAALQGRWGMVPADCTSTRGDAKGLLNVSATSLTFYESVARLGTIKARDDSMIRATFAFSGEGQTWTRDETLSASGNTLTRVERGGGEPGGTYSYTKCTT